MSFLALFRWCLDILNILNGNFNTFSGQTTDGKCLIIIFFKLKIIFIYLKISFVDSFACLIMDHKSYTTAENCTEKFFL